MIKYKVRLKVNYKALEFVFDDRLEALDFMETAWTHKTDCSDGELCGVKLELVEEA